MSETGNGKGGHGVLAWRTLYTLGIGVLAVLSMRVLSNLDKYADKVDALNDRVVDVRSTSESRFNAHVQRLDTIDRRNDQQDGKIDELQRRVWRIPEGRNP